MVIGSSILNRQRGHEFRIYINITFSFMFLKLIHIITVLISSNKLQRSTNSFPHNRISKHT